MMALSLKAANSAVLTRCDSLVRPVRASDVLIEPLELVDLAGEVTARAAVEPGQLDHGTPDRAVVARETRTQARRGRMNSEPIRPDDAEQHPAERDALAGGVADLELDPAVDAVEADRAEAVGQLHGLARRSLIRASGPSRSGSELGNVFSFDLSSE